MSNASKTTISAGAEHAYKTYFKAKSTIDKYFVNSMPIVSVGHKRFTISDVVSCAVLSGTNTYLLGTRGSGKTLLSEAVYYGIFNGNGFYLRGDLNLQIKDLFTKLNLNGKNEAEIYQIADSIRFNVALIDELNRVPGIVQNGFLNILDGYVEIRGRKYRLGGESQYILTLATGNMQNDGDYPGVFDEDIALMNRIQLVINTDASVLARGDIAAISAMHSNKSRIAPADMSEDVLKGNQFLRKEMVDDPDLSPALALLNEYTYKFFRYVELGNGTMDKLNEPEWRSRLSGEHAGASLHPLCSDIATRTLMEASKLGFAMYKTAETEAQMIENVGKQTSWYPMKSFLQSYVAALKLALAYDRHFLPADVLRAQEKTREEVLEGAFTELSDSLRKEPLDDAVAALSEFYEAKAKNDRYGMLKSKKFAENAYKEKGAGIFGVVADIEGNCLQNIEKGEFYSTLMGELVRIPFQKVNFNK